jgi:hypothetical protein
VGLIEAQKLLGRSDPKLTAQIYTHLEVEQLRDAIEKLPELEVDARDQAWERRPGYCLPHSMGVRPADQVLTLAYPAGV